MGLHIAPGAQVPEMDPVAVFVGEQISGTMPFSNAAATPTRSSPM